nr:hypothetical protein [Tanacetum cinerariifolium]
MSLATHKGVIFYVVLPVSTKTGAAVADATAAGDDTTGGDGWGVSDLYLLPNGPINDDGEGNVSDSGGTTVWDRSSLVGSVFEGSESGGYSDDASMWASGAGT